MALFDLFKRESGTGKPSPGASAGESASPKASSGLFGKIGKAFAGRTRVDAVFLDELEEILIRSDAGVKTTLEIIDRLQAKAAKEKYLGEADLRRMLREILLDLLMGGEGRPADATGDPELPAPCPERPYVILVVGVNGVGKTTSIGKLAWRLKQGGRSVLLGAADTFRAAAVKQLVIWSERAGVPIVEQGQNADPAAVSYDTVSAGKARGADVVIVDTAGRLHNRKSLMDELSKIRRVMGKVVPDAPHEVLLVLDGSTGQNAIQQARAFREAVEITGLILTKLDGTAKGGIVLAIANELRIPVRYVGTGEGIEDFDPFDAARFADAILG